MSASDKKWNKDTKFIAVHVSLLSVTCTTTKSLLQRYKVMHYTYILLHMYNLMHYIYIINRRCTLSCTTLTMQLTLHFPFAEYLVPPRMDIWHTCGSCNPWPYQETAILTTVGAQAITTSQFITNS